MFAGRITSKVDPLPAALSTRISPLWACAIHWEIANPRPVPDESGSIPSPSDPICPAAGSIHLVEAVEYPPQVFSGDAYPVIIHPHPGLVLLAIQPRAGRNMDSGVRYTRLNI